MYIYIKIQKKNVRNRPCVFTLRTHDDEPAQTKIKKKNFKNSLFLVCSSRGSVLDEFDQGNHYQQGC